MIPSGPSKAAEALVAIFVPPACREEVLGDLHERYRSAGAYAWEALRTVPLVILSRIRRTADPPVLLMLAFVLYLSFAGAARLREDRALLPADWGLLRLAIPAGMTLLSVILDDAYARPGIRSPLALMRGPAIGALLALLSVRAFPGWLLVYGCAMGFLLSSAIRLLFPPATGKFAG